MDGRAETTEKHKKTVKGGKNGLNTGYFNGELQIDHLKINSVYRPSSAVSEIKAEEKIHICFVAQGEGVHRVLNQDIPCKKGDICVIPPNVPHGFFLMEKGDALLVKVIRFSADDWFSGAVADREKPDYCFGLFKENSVIAYANLNAYMEERAALLIEYIENELLEKNNEWHEMVRGYIANLLISIGRYINSAIKSVSFASEKGWKTVSSAIRIINEEFCDETLTLERIADRLYISKSQLSRSFKSITGIYFFDYLKDVRMKNVYRLLEKDEGTVFEIAKNCGFNNMAAFYKTFASMAKMTPNEYRLLKHNNENALDDYKKMLKGEKIMSILNEISENLQKGKAKIVKEYVQKALDEGVKPEDILDQGLLQGMNVVGEKFKNNEVYVPEVLVAARAMNMGTEILKPYLQAAGVKATGKVCIGTVQGDLHDIGKNIVKMMLEGKGLEVVDLGTDVSAESFVETAINENCQVICCSALLTTTMGVMADVVKLAEEKGIRDKVKIMIGGAPISQDFCDKIGADCYTVDAASAAEAAVNFCKN
ncbi:MAG: cobalamin-dependent protein [Clostridia bacterium]|nr:cobalamin-dependent protein [Clostridia bacterium]